MITNLGVIGNPGFTDRVGGRGAAASTSTPPRSGSARWPATTWPTSRPGPTSSSFARPSTRSTHLPGLRGSVQGGNRPGFSTAPDDDGDGLVDEDPLNGKDDDGDGKIDEDYAAISQQMFSCEYWDYTEEASNAYPEHRPLNLRVHQESYAWSTEGANEFVGFDFKIINDGFELLRQVYLGFFVDSDVGPQGDVRATTRTTAEPSTPRTRPSST